MSNFKYMLKKLKTVNYKELKGNAKEISEKINKSSFYVLFDMIKCAYKYGSGYTNYSDFKFYSLSDEEKSTFLTDRYNNLIIDKYNKKEDCCKFNDKILFYNTFNEFLDRKFIDLRSVSYKDFKEFIIGKEKIVVKCINGENLEIIDIDKTKLKNEYNILKIYNGIMKKDQVIVEDYIDLKDVIHVVSFIDDKREIVILNFVLDNDKISGENIIMNKIANYDLVKSFVSKLNLIVPSVRYVSWKIAFKDNSLVLLDASSSPEIYQNKESKTGDLVKYKKYIEM